MESKRQREGEREMQKIERLRDGDKEPEGPRDGDKETERLGDGDEEPERKREGDERDRDNARWRQSARETDR